MTRISAPSVPSSAQAPPAFQVLIDTKKGEIHEPRGTNKPQPTRGEEAVIDKTKRKSDPGQDDLDWQR